MNPSSDAIGTTREESNAAEVAQAAVEPDGILLAQAAVEPDGILLAQAAVEPDGILLAQAAVEPDGILLARVVAKDIASVEEALDNESAALAMEVRQLEARMTALGDVAPIGIYSSTPGGGHQYMNAVLMQILGVAPGEDASHWPELIHPDDRERVLSEWRTSIENGSIFSSRHRFIADGQVISTHVLSSPYYVDGKLTGHVGTVEDITEKERVESERTELITRLQQMFDRMPIGCILNDAEYKFTYWNPAAELIFGYSIEEVRGQHPFGVITPAEAQPVVESIFKRLAEGDQSADAIGTNMTKDGRTITCSWHNSPLRSSDGTFIGMMSMCQDITSRVEAEEALRRREEQYRQMVDTAQEGVWLIDAEANTAFANQRMAEMLGYAPAEMLGKSMYDYMDDEGRAEADVRFAQRKQGASEQHDFRFQHRDGSDVWTIISASPMYNAQGDFVGALGMITDITERKRNEEMVWWQAYHDALTGLPNRALFEDRLSQLLVMSRRQHAHVAVLFLDLDRFKHVNDTLGHGRGDALLKVVAERLISCLRAEDTIARMGGDEFTILLPGIENPESAIKVAQKLLEALAQPIEIDEQDLFATGSIGISLYPIDGEDTQTLLKHADIAMYRAKEQGGNSYYLFTQAMNTSALEHLILENSLRKAILRDEFHLVYQPLVDLGTGEVTAVEALCRWRHPELGVVQPAQFISLAEETGMIVQIGEWVIREACRQAAVWRSSGHALRVSVNISARQFAQPGLCEVVARAVEDARLDPQWLDLELTESAIMKNSETAVDTLQRLRELGVRLALDDFGTGYSSLSYLRQFPFDVLKIDRAFVASIVHDKVDQALVRAIVELALALELQVVAEGVESEDQCSVLQDLGCNIMQGYLFSPPVMADRIAALRPLMRAA